MAKADYMLCSVCDGKAFYDAGIDWFYFGGQVAALCDDCAKTNEIVVRKRQRELNDYNRFTAQPPTVEGE